jgi:hypothetical protein
MAICGEQSRELQAPQRCCGTTAMSLVWSSTVILSWQPHRTERPFEAIAADIEGAGAIIT